LPGVGSCFPSSDKILCIFLKIPKSSRVVKLEKKFAILFSALSRIVRIYKVSLKKFPIICGNCFSGAKQALEE
jgi:hypothetical protein